VLTVGLLIVAFLIVAYLVLNSGLSMLNRWALGMYGLKFPIIMTTTHMIFGTWALTPLMLLNDEYALEHEATVRGQGVGLVIVALLNGVQISANNASLGEMELSMNQVVRAFCPVLVALLGVCIEGKVPTSREVVALLLVCFGVMICVYEESNNSWLGLALVWTSAIVQSGQMSFSSRLMSKRLDSFQMTFYTGGVAYLALLPLAVHYEAAIFVEQASQRPLTVTLFLLCSCCMAVLYNVVFFQCMRSLSAVGVSVLGNVKIVLLILSSALVLGELSSWHFNQYIGCVLTFGGTAVYSHLRQATKK